MTKAFLGLGSNIGNKKKNITLAIKYLSEHKNITLKKSSSTIETKAVSPQNQPNFLNVVVQIETTLMPEKLLTITQDIEKKLKRKAKGNYGPRTIDIDILFFGKELILSNELTVPHPLIHERKFVLKPLMEIAPDFVHPTLDEPIKKIYEDLTRWDN